jgi:hypothetical protein
MSARRVLNIKAPDLLAQSASRTTIKPAGGRGEESMNLSTRGSRFGGLVLLPAALMLATALASASPIYGEFGFSGPGVMVFNSLGAGYIEFCTDADPSCSSASATGDFGVSGPGTGSFSVLTTGGAGAIDNVTDTAPPVSPFTYLPVGVPVGIDDYLVLTAFPTWDFQANVLVPASCPSTSTQMCLGPFELSQDGPNVSVTMDVFGTLINTADGSDSDFDLAFTGQYLNTTIPAVETAGESLAGAFSDSWAATAEASPTPEAGTMSMMLLAAGLVGISRIRRRRKS